MLALVFEVAVAAAILRALNDGNGGEILRAASIAGGTTIALLVWFQIVVLVHELGHLVAGLRAGLVFRILTVGSIQITSKDGRLSVHVLTGPMLAGMVVMTPLDNERVASRWIQCIAGGPLASVGLVILLIALNYGLGGTLDPRVSVGLGITVLQYATLVSILILPGTLVPFTTKTGYMTDMLYIWKMSRKGGQRDYLIALLMLGREVFSGIRARDWSPSLVQAVRSPFADLDGRVRGAIMAYYFAYDSGEVHEARAILGEAYTLAVGFKKENLLREIILFESAINAAWIDKDAPAAQTMMSSTWGKHDSIEGTRRTALAAIAGARQDFAGALKELDAAEQKLHKTAKRSSGSIGLDLDRVNAMRADYLGQLQNPEPIATSDEEIELENRLQIAKELYGRRDKGVGPSD
jgi:hypothetical protein